MKCATPTANRLSHEGTQVFVAMANHEIEEAEDRFSLSRHRIKVQLLLKEYHTTEAHRKKKESKQESRTGYTHQKGYTVSLDEQWERQQKSRHVY